MGLLVLGVGLGERIFNKITVSFLEKVMSFYTLFKIQRQNRVNWM